MKHLFFLILAGCAVQGSGIAPTMHPTATAGQTSVGVSLGGLFATDENDSSQEGNSELILPWGEGWARWGMGSGQLDVHILPGLGSVGYRIDLVPMGPGVGFALVPSGHAAMTYAWNSKPNSDDSSGGILLLGGSLTGIVLIPSGNGFWYVAPRVGLTNGQLLGDQGDNVDSVNLLTVGLAVGVDLSGQGHQGIGTSFELAVQRSSNTDSDVNDEPLWLIAPTFGLRL